MKNKEEIEGLGNLFLINETRERVGDDIPENYTQDDIIKAVAWGYEAGYYDAPTVNEWHYPSKGELPQEWGWYLVAISLPEDNIRYIEMCTYDDGRWIQRWVQYEQRIELRGVYAWMPLPNQPKEEA